MSDLSSPTRRLLLLGACAAAGAGIGPALHAAATRDSGIQPEGFALKRGVNLADWLQNKRQSRITDMQLAGLKEAGFDHVRLPVDPWFLGWDFNAAANEPILTDLHTLDTALAAIHDTGLRIVLDVHPGRQAHAYLKEHADETEQIVIRTLTFLVNRYKTRYGPDALCFELMNEPYRFYPAQQWSAFQGRLVKILRKETDRHWFVVNGVWHPVSSLRSLEIYPDTKLIYGFHYYRPFVVTHQGATWEPATAKLLPYLSNIPYPSDMLDLDAVRLKPGADEDYIMSRLEAYKNENWNLGKLRKDLTFHADWARSNKVPVYCTEVGVMRKTIDPDSRLRWLSDVTQAMNEHGIGWAIWDYCSDFGIAQCGATPTIIEPEVAKALHLKS